MVTSKPLHEASVSVFISTRLWSDLLIRLQVNSRARLVFRFTAIPAIARDSGDLPSVLLCASVVNSLRSGKP
jgi:hypothetical protein